MICQSENAVDFDLDLIWLIRNQNNQTKFAKSIKKNLNVQNLLYKQTKSVGDGIIKQHCTELF